MRVRRTEPDNGSSSPATEKTADGVALIVDGFPNPKAYDFWGYQLALSEDQWKEHIGYLYRINPTMIRAIGDGAYLVKFMSPITREWVKENYGGKGFKILFNRKNRTIFTEFLNIEADPLLQTGEKIDGAASAAAATAASTAAATAASTGVTSEVLSMLREQINRLEASKQDPGMQAQAVKGMMEIMTTAYKSSLESVTNTTPKPGESAAEKMMMMMFSKLMDKQFSEPPDPMKQVDTMLSILEKVRDETGPRARGPAGWIAVFEKFAEKTDLGAVLDRFQAITHNIAVARQAGTPATMPPTPGAPALAPIPAIATTPASAPAIPTVTPQVIPQERNPQRDMQLKMLIAQWLIKGESGDRAAGAIAMMDAEFAVRLANDLRTDAGRAALATDPVFSQVIQHPNLRKFCEEYVAFIDQEFEDDEEPEPIIPEGQARPVAVG